MQIISGSSNKPLAELVAKTLNYPLLRSEVTCFQDGELKIQIHDKIGDEVIIIQSTSYPANDNVMELLFLADTAKRAGAKYITAIIPYFGYSRQDRCTYKYGPLSASLVIKMLEASGISKVITVDLHSAQLEGVFSIPIINISIDKIFHPIMNSANDYVVISPDIGGIPRARSLSNLLHCDLAIINKSRDGENNVTMSEVYGNVRGKKCILVDDIIDSGNTLIKAANLLSQNGAASVEAFASHAILSGDAKDIISSSLIDKVFISNSVYHSMLHNKFVVNDIAPVICKYFS